MNKILLIPMTSAVGPVLIAAAVGHSHAITPTAANLVNCWNCDQSRRQNGNNHRRHPQTRFPNRINRLFPVSVLNDVHLKYTHTKLETRNNQK